MEIKLKVKRVARLESSVILDLIEVLMRSEKHSASDSNNLSSRQKPNCTAMSVNLRVTTPPLTQEKYRKQKFDF